MKKQVFTTVLLSVTIWGGHVYAQQNTLPTTGNVGIGTTNPSTKLQVNGAAQIDSALVVKDSVTIKKNLRVEENVTFLGNTKLNNAKVTGNLKLLDLNEPNNSNMSNKNILITNQNGLVRKIPYDTLVNKILTNVDVYVPAAEHVECPVDLDGNIVYLSPTWQHAPEEIFVLNNPCIPDVRVGIGVKPKAKLHVLTTGGKNTHPLLIEKPISGSTDNYKLLQLDNNGLLYAREVKVNLDSWPDYVFEKEYPLMNLSEVDEYIQANGHLPNVPSAKEIATDGVNLGEMNRILLEKVEELTLHLIDIKEQVNKQDELLQQQQETIRLQQALLEKLEKSTEHETTKP